MNKILDELIDVLHKNDIPVLDATCTEARRYVDDKLAETMTEALVTVEPPRTIGLPNAEVRSVFTDLINGWTVPCTGGEWLLMNGKMAWFGQEIACQCELEFKWVETA